MTLTSVIEAQCTFDFNADINDLETIDLQIHVDNLVNEDLSGSQGICAVELHFRHSYVGDLTIDLISPSGQSIQLVGAVTDQINPTNLTTWDVRFLRCGFPVAPDAGFSAQWNNNQPWQVFTTYTGSYYPASGCLEDFNTGSANGIWQISITDHDAPQTGVFLGVTIIFCDNTGLVCNFCGVDAGTFAISQLSLCEGEDIEITPLYPDTFPDPLVYRYSYLVTEDNINAVFVDELSTSALSPGTYTICGISYGVADSVALFNQFDTMSFPEIYAALIGQELSYCADISETCMMVDVTPAIDTTFLDLQICAGASVTIGGQTFSTTGTYIVSVNLNGPCDSMIVLDLDVTEVEARVQQQDTISCTQSVTVLDGSGSMSGPGATYQWSTLNGNITSLPDQAMISIDGSGSYRLIVTYQGCTDEIVYDVIGDESFPFLYFEGGTLSCANPVFTFNTVAYPTDVQYAWNGPLNFTSAEPEPTVSIPGLYTLMITNTEDCSVSASAEILLDTVVNAAINVVSIECAFQRATLRAEPGVQGTQYVWTTPSGMNTFNQETYATLSGQYCVEVTAINGCVASACIDYVADYIVPDLALFVSQDTLHCGDQVQLIASSSLPDLNYQWIGPGGLLSGDSTLYVNGPGQYIVLATGENLCTSADTTIIHPGDDLLEVVTFADTLDCQADTVLIGAVVLDPLTSYTWTGPGLVDTFNAIIRVTQAGTYDVTIISQSGCEQHASVFVPGDYATVFYNLVLDTITCAHPVASLSFVTMEDYNVIDWLLPDGSHISQAILNAIDPGNYSLTIIGDNGCPRTLVANLIADILPPILFVEAETLGCNDSVQVHTILVDSILSYTWTGPGLFTSSQPNPFVSSAGIYLLEVIGLNGCEANEVLFVGSNMEFPSLTLTAEELDCIDSTAILMISSPDTALVYAWFLDGMQISDSALIGIMDPGQYIGVVTGPNGCSAVDTVEVLPPEVPRVFAETDTITCISQATLTAMSDLPDVDFSWEDSAGITGNGTQYTATNAGPITLTVTGSNGCKADTTLIIGIDTMPPVAIAVNNELILCNMQSINLDASGSIGQMLLYSWTTPNGTINSGATSSTVIITGEGTYIVSVLDASNGCLDTDTVEIVEGESVLGEIFLSIISECDGNGHGSISIDSVSGATTSLMYTLNGVAGGPVFGDLSVGEFHVVVLDSFGCSTDTAVFIFNTSSMNSISLGEDKSIIVGDSVLLEATVELDPTEIMAVHWGQPVVCDTCLANVVAPLHTATYEVFLTDLFGCVASDEVTVFVEEKPKFYIANVFSPNGDEINDYLTIATHPGIERVLRFSVYDRWGNVVFHVTDFDAADGFVTWDGTFGGRKLDPAVFVYKIEVKLVTGRVETHHGAITLVK